LALGARVCLNDPEVGLAGEDEDEGVVGVHLEVGEQPEFFQGTGLEEMGVVDNEEDGFACGFFGLQESALDLGADGAFGKPWGEAEDSVDVVEWIGIKSIGGIL